VAAQKPLDLTELRSSLESTVHQQLMSDVPYGVLISGGLDSSVIAAITQRFAPNRVEEGDKVAAWWPRLHSFCIGLEGSPDVAKARKVAKAIGTVHHEFVFTIQEGLDALRDVIYHIETYDVTSIRASTPMFLMMRRIKAMGIKMVLSGEGADEVFGGYLYFHKAPNSREFHEETVRKLDLLYKYDCLRANKSSAAWGVEIRVPFLDREFLDVAMSFNPQEKMVGPGRMEKYPLRKAFEGYVPDEILWRQKEQFSDGVGYGWIDSLKANAEKAITDTQMKNAGFRFPYNTPVTKEAYFYREIFESHFPGDAAAACVPGGPSIACSTPTAIAWDESFRTEFRSLRSGRTWRPSGRQCEIDRLLIDGLNGRWCRIPSPHHKTTRRSSGHSPRQLLQQSPDFPAEAPYFPSSPKGVLHKKKRKACYHPSNRSALGGRVGVPAKVAVGAKGGEVKRFPPTWVV